jgi:ActR/RegA family two-component response regulator
MDMVMPADEIPPKDEKDDPETAGLRLVQQMLGRRPDTRIVLVTGLPPGDSDVTTAVSLGVVGMLRKPVRPEDVKATLAALFPDENALSYFG